MLPQSLSVTDIPCPVETRCRGHFVRHVKLVEHCGKWPRHPGNSRTFPLMYKCFPVVSSSYNTSRRVKVQASHLVTAHSSGTCNLSWYNALYGEWLWREASPSTLSLPFIVFLKITIYQTAIYSYNSSFNWSETNYSYFYGNDNILCVLPFLKVRDL